MSTSRQCVLLGAYNQIISRGYQELSSRCVNYVLHLIQPHTGRRKQKAWSKTSLAKKKNSASLSLFCLSTLPHPPLTPKLNIDRNHASKHRPEKFPKWWSTNQCMWHWRLRCNAQLHTSMENGKWGVPEHASGSSACITAFSTNMHHRKSYCELNARTGFSYPP